MSDSDMITFKCIDCQKPVVIDDSKPPNDNDIIRCQECGRTFGTYAEVKKAMIKMGKEEINKWLDNANLPPWITIKKFDV